MTTQGRFRIPAGITKYRIASVLVINDGTTASLTTAQFGVFTAGGGGGAALVASGRELFVGALIRCADACGKNERANTCADLGCSSDRSEEEKWRKPSTSDHSR
jgi:hypothetical protein